MNIRLKYLLGDILDSLGLVGLFFRLAEKIKSIFVGKKLKNLPPPYLLVLVIGKADYRWFLRGGKLAYQGLITTLHSHRISLDNKVILDFGCGCGRVIRYLRAQHGTDYNPRLIQWCQNNLPGEFKINQLTPPLDYRNGQFDLVYAFSVFTHLTEELQIAWIGEMARIIKKGGYLFFTAHGKYFYNKLNSEERERLTTRGVVVRHGKEAGMNVCVSFHTPKFIKTFRKFRLVDFIEGGAKGNNNQDIYLLKRV